MHQTIIMKEGEIKHQKAQKKIPRSRWDSNSDNPIEFSIGHFTTELLQEAGSKFKYYTPAGEDRSDTCLKSAVHHTWLPIRYFQGASSLCFKARLSAKPLIWKWFILMQIKLIFTREGFALSLILKNESFWNSEMAY